MDHGPVAGFAVDEDRVPLGGVVAARARWPLAEVVARPSSVAGGVGEEPQVDDVVRLRAQAVVGELALGVADPELGPLDGVLARVGDDDVGRGHDDGEVLGDVRAKGGGPCGEAFRRRGLVAQGDRIGHVGAREGQHTAHQPRGGGAEEQSAQDARRGHEKIGHRRGGKVLRRCNFFGAGYSVSPMSGSSARRT